MTGFAKSSLSVILLVAWMGACSDDDVKNDVGVSDKGVDSTQTDTAKTDTAQTDTAQTDTAQTDTAATDTAATDTAATDTAAADTATSDAATGDLVLGDAGNLTASCNALIKTCPSSLTWPQYIKPFTSTNCVKVVSCVDKLYSGLCDTKFKELVKCISTITASSQCDTKCSAQIGYLSTNCTCPSACGVACP